MHYRWILALLLASNVHAGQAPGDVLELNVGEVVRLPRLQPDQGAIKIDGKLTEPAWRHAVKITDFRVIEPDTMAEARWPTTLYLLYDDQGIYGAYDLEQPPESIVAVLSPRDTGTTFGDFVGLTFDTSGDGKYGYWVSLAPSGVKTDGTLAPESQFSRDWDGAWLGETAITERGWTAEIFLPWSQVAMPKQAGARRISLFASRAVKSIGERWGVPALPFTITKWIQHMRPLELEGVDPRQQWSVIPYASVTQDEVRGKTKLRGGAEVFWRPSTNFQLSATALPDFGNVESDDAVVNLSALETFFPEKRLFFLEGRDIFFTSPRADPGRNFFPVTVLNTRRIGGAPRPPTLPAGATLPASERAQPVELYGAVKATGQFGAMRYGVLAASEDNVTLNTDDGQRVRQAGSDYGVARFLWEQNAAGSYRAIGTISTLTAHPQQDAVVHGLDLHYLTTDGRWKVDGQLLFSDKDDVGQGWGGLADVVFTPRRGLKAKLELEHYDAKIDINDLGFLQRNDISRVGFDIDYNRVALGWARNLNLYGKTIYEVNGDGDTTRKGFSATTDILLNNLGRLEASVLLFGRRTDDLESFGNGNFIIPDRWEFDADYSSDRSRRFSYGIGFDLDQEKTSGTAVKARASITWRASPAMKIELSAERVRRDAWLLHQEERNFTTFKTREWRPKLAVDYFFTAHQQLRLSAQWIGIQARERDFFLIPDDGGELLPTDKPPGPTDDFGISNLNVQLRYRWEIAPLSDLFLVYTLSGNSRLDRASFSSLFRAAHEDPITEQLILKLRYRFGS